MPRTTPKKKKKWRAIYYPPSPDNGKTIRRAKPGKQQTRKKRGETTMSGVNLNETLKLAKIAKIQANAKRTRNKRTKRNRTQKRIPLIVRDVIKVLDGVTISEKGKGDVIVNVNVPTKKKGGGKKKTKKKTHQKQTKHYKIEIIKKKPLTIQVWDYNTEKKEWEKEGKPTQIKKGGRRRKTKKRALKKRTRKKN
tara:strand:- start:3702 stop:4283 length:582 start_codon:yes stop_codon:yes gene_type:complete